MNIQILKTNLVRGFYISICIVVLEVLVLTNYVFTVINQKSFGIIPLLYILMYFSFIVVYVIMILLTTMYKSRESYTVIDDQILNRLINFSLGFALPSALALWKHCGLLPPSFFRSAEHTSELQSHSLISLSVSRL